MTVVLSFTPTTPSRECLVVKILDFYIYRSYVDTANVFGPGVLLHRVASSCLKVGI